MGKIILQLLVLVGLFLATWFGLSQIDFIGPDGLDKFSRSSERKLGELILESVRKDNETVTNARINSVIDSIGRRLCDANGIQYDSIKVYVVVNPDINAFTLPDQNMVIFTGLIAQSRNAEEVAGVMAHEIGHMEKNHVMKKLLKEVGITMLLTLTNGGNHLEIIQEMSRLLSSSAFDRTQEREADRLAAEMMAKADIDPENLANFLFRFSQKTKLPEELAWISTHPNGSDRAAVIINQKKNLSIHPRPIIYTPWESIKDVAREESKQASEVH